MFWPRSFFGQGSFSFNFMAYFFVLGYLGIMVTRQLQFCCIFPVTKDKFDHLPSENELEARQKKYKENYLKENKLQYLEDRLKATITVKLDSTFDYETLKKMLFAGLQATMTRKSRIL